jgi:predicted aldo/keto reductase-like oxidoreductase
LKRKLLGKTGLEVSPVGIGGHYRAMEEGHYEERTAYIDKEIPLRCRIVEKAIGRGINYFDTTWKNEAELLGKALEQTGLRDHAVVNGMVLGSFTGSKAAGQTVEAYFDQWLNHRLASFPGGYFDMFMINAIEEGYNEGECERLVRHLEKRRTAGDFKAFGFSCHDVFLARKIADRFPQFQSVMVAYNYMNRRYETAFDGNVSGNAAAVHDGSSTGNTAAPYGGNAAIIAMKPLVWAEYGVPFCALNQLDQFSELFGFKPEPAIATSAFRFILSNPRVTTVISAVNSLQEVDLLADAADAALTGKEETSLKQYQAAQAGFRAIPLFLSAMKADNLRMNFFGVINLSRVLDIPAPEFSLNEEGARDRILQHGERLKVVVTERSLLPVAIA